ncbi:unnamed protein product [Macrosiphum euphorbiae]|uniref:C2H2-type domain-containing protein n=1 Tax=Macrosiphum euphorbiae TaxID=13131 RepID=A0AAV0VQF3_9HEMI|nr:unnamed protein product [Macrosiphum euphorbiae]
MSSRFSTEALSGAGEASTEEAASSWSSAVSEDHTSPDSCATSNSRPGSTVDHRRDRHSRPPSYATAGAAAAAAVAAVTAAANATDANPYACQYCDKTFPRGSYLKKHEQVGFRFRYYLAIPTSYPTPIPLTITVKYYIKDASQNFRLRQNTVLKNYRFISSV